MWPLLKKICKVCHHHNLYSFKDINKLLTHILNLCNFSRLNNSHNNICNNNFNSKNNNNFKIIIIRKSRNNNNSSLIRKILQV